MKMARTQQSGKVVAVTGKYFAVAKKNRQVCKDITTLCFHAEKPGFIKKPLKCVWCDLDNYFFCRVCLDSSKKKITLNLNTMQGNGIGKK